MMCMTVYQSEQQLCPENAFCCHPCENLSLTSNACFPHILLHKQKLEMIKYLKRQNCKASLLISLPFQQEGSIYLFLLHQFSFVTSRTCLSFSMIFFSLLYFVPKNQAENLHNKTRGLGFVMFSVMGFH